MIAESSIVSSNIMPRDELERLRAAKRRLEVAISCGRSRKWCLSLWSRFILARDGERCVICEAKTAVQAHHIFRRTTLFEASFELGNGISLCRSCHANVHKACNGRPAAGEPLNTRGGDDPDEMAYLFGTLVEDADARSLPHDEFYFVSDQILDRFVAWQGFKDIRDLATEGRISRLKAAHEIWRHAPEPWYGSIATDIAAELLSCTHN